MAQHKAFKLGGIGHPCCCSGACNTKICLTWSCDGGLLTGTATGVLVTVKSGATTIASGTVDSSGCVTLNIGTAGTYTVTTTGNARYTNTSGSHALTCGGTTNIVLSVGTGYVCCDCWVEPVPTTLNYTIDGQSGTYTLGGGNSFDLTTTASPTTNANGPTSCGGVGYPTSDPCGPYGAGTVVGNFTLPDCGACLVDLCWYVATNCNQPDTSSCPSITSGNYPNYLGGSYYGDPANFGCGAVSVPVFENQWLVTPPGTNCDGFCLANVDFTHTFGTGLPVPVNISYSFPSVSGFTPPFSSLLITE